MKNFKSISIILFLFISFSSYSQIKVNSDGNVGIGSEPDDGIYELRVRDMKIITTENEAYPYIEILSSGSPVYKIIRPSQNNRGTIGTYGREFYSVYAQYHYANSVLLTSDKRLKENFRDIETPLEKLLQVKGLKYDFINQENDSLSSAEERQKQEKMQKDHFGFVA